MHDNIPRQKTAIRLNWLNKRTLEDSFLMNLFKTHIVWSRYDISAISYCQYYVTELRYASGVQKLRISHLLHFNRYYFRNLPLFSEITVVNAVIKITLLKKISNRWKILNFDHDFSKFILVFKQISKVNAPPLYIFIITVFTCEAFVHCFSLVDCKIFEWITF